MEKYCTTCGRAFDDLNYKICPFCGEELDTRYGRQPIPRQLRHEVFKRDGYRCRECGASKDETSLEIDHIVPVAKGGTNDIDNLQTLCRECNRMKHTDEWVGGETDLEAAQNTLDNLKAQLKLYNDKLVDCTDEDEEIEYKYRIAKLEERIPKVREEVLLLKKEEIKRIEQQKEQAKKDKLFKKLYVRLDEDMLIYLSEYNYMEYKNKEDTLKYLINRYTEEEIKEILRNKDSHTNVRDNIEPGDIGIIMSGPLEGQKARVIRLWGHSTDIEVNLIEADFPIDTTINSIQFKKI